MNKVKSLGLGAVLAASVLSGCANNGYRPLDSETAIRDFTLSQTQYVDDLVVSAACKNTKLEDYEDSLSDGVKKYFSAMVDSGANVCDLAKSVDRDNFGYDLDLVKVIALGRASNYYGCDVPELEQRAITSNNSSLESKFKAADKIVNRNPEFINDLSTKVRNCVSQYDIDKTAYIADVEDLTSLAIWASLGAYSSGKSAGTKTCTSVGNGSGASNIGNGTTSVGGTNSSSTLGVGGVVVSNVLNRGC